MATPPGLQTFSPGSSQDTTLTFTNTTGAPVSDVKLDLAVPAGWTSAVAGSAETSKTFTSVVAPGASVSATFKITSGSAAFNGDVVGRVSWADRIGMPLRHDGEGMILAKACVTFKRPVGYPAHVKVDLLAGPIGRSSFTLLNTLTVEGENVASATGECVTVWYDYVAQKSMPLPPRLRAILEGTINSMEA